MIIAEAFAAAAVTVASAASSNTSVAAVFNTAPGLPGAGNQNVLNLGGSNRQNGHRFKVVLSGLVTLAAGTYTATVQPLLYASTTSGFTAAAANAIVSAAATNVIVAATATAYANWSVSAELEGDSTSGQLTGIASESVNSNGTQYLNSTPAVIKNAPTSINFSTEPPLQFSAGVTLVGNVGGASVLTLTDFYAAAD